MGNEIDEAIQRLREDDGFAQSYVTADMVLKVCAEVQRLQDGLVAAQVQCANDCAAMIAHWKMRAEAAEAEVKRLRGQ